MSILTFTLSGRKTRSTGTKPRFSISWKTARIITTVIVAFAASITLPPHTAYTRVLFQDNFNSGTASSEWVSKICCQWVQDGWYYAKNTTGSLDSLVIVHDDDQTWRDYKLALKAQFLEQAWFFTILIRSNDWMIYPGSHIAGKGYEIIFYGSDWGAPDTNTVVLDRMDGNTQTFPLKTRLPLPLDPPLNNLSSG